MLLIKSKVRKAITILSLIAFIGLSYYCYFVTKKVAHVVSYKANDTSKSDEFPCNCDDESAELCRNLNNALSSNALIEAKTPSFMVFNIVIIPIVACLPPIAMYFADLIRNKIPFCKDGVRPKAMFDIMGLFIFSISTLYVVIALGIGWKLLYGTHENSITGTDTNSQCDSNSSICCTYQFKLSDLTAYTIAYILLIGHFIIQSLFFVVASYGQFLTFCPLKVGKLFEEETTANSDDNFQEMPFIESEDDEPL